MNVQDLLIHERFLRGLARSLLADPAGADDAVQEAWLVAAHGRDGARDVRSWLAGVVRNLARRMQRTETRRMRRERVRARAEAVRPTADVVAEEEMRRRVAGAVLRLEEPYRTALLLRYYEGMAPRAIARRLDVAGSTVRSRLQRGLKRLRGELDAQCEGDRRAWCLALAPLLRGAPAVSALAAGGIAAAVVVVGLLVVHVAGDAAPARDTGPDARAAPHVAREPGVPAAVSTSPAPPPAPVAEEPAPRRVRGSVRSARGERASGAHVVFVEMRQGFPVERATPPAAAGGGSFELDPPGAGTYLAIAYDDDHRPAHAVLELRDGEPVGRLALRLEEGVTLTGQVTSAGGRPLADVGVHARRTGDDGRRIEVPGTDLALVFRDGAIAKLRVAARTGADGRYRMAGLAPDVHRVWVEEIVDAHPSLAEDDDGPRFARAVAAPAAGIDFRVPHGTFDLRVRADGQPLAAARLFTGGLSTGVDGEGRRAMHVRPGRDYEFRFEHEGYAPRTVTATAPDDGGRREVVVELARKQGTATLVVVLRPGGPEPRPPLPKRYGFELTAEGTRHRRTVDVENGRCTLAGLDPGVVRVAARAGGWWLTDSGYYRDAAAEVTLAPGATTELALPLEPAGRLEVLLRTADGRSDVPARIEVAPLGGAPLPLTIVKGGKSGYVFLRDRVPDRTGPAIVASPLAPGSYRVHIDTGAEQRSVEVSIRAGETTRAEIVLAGG